MATNLFGGREAQVLISSATSIAGADFGRARNFNFSVSQDPIDVTSFDSSGWRELIDNIKEWSFTAEVLALSTAATSQQDELRTALSSGTRQYFQVQNSTGAGSQTFRGWGYVSGWTLGGEVRGAQLYNFSVEGDGTLTEA